MDKVVAEFKQNQENARQFQWKLKYIEVVKELQKKHMENERAKRIDNKQVSNGWIAWLFGWK